MILILSVLTTIFTNIPFHISISLQIPCIGRSHQGQPLETSTWHAQLSANDTSPLTSLRAVLVLWHQMKGIYWIINTALRNQSVYRNTFWLNQNQLKSKFATCNIQVTFFFFKQTMDSRNLSDFPLNTQKGYWLNTNILTSCLFTNGKGQKNDGA